MTPQRKSLEKTLKDKGVKPEIINLSGQPLKIDFDIRGMNKLMILLDRTKLYEKQEGFITTKKYQKRYLNKRLEDYDNWKDEIIEKIQDYINEIRGEEK